MSMQILAMNQPHTRSSAVQTCQKCNHLPAVVGNGKSARSGVHTWWCHAKLNSHCTVDASSSWSYFVLGLCWKRRLWQEDEGNCNQRRRQCMHWLVTHQKHKQCMLGAGRINHMSLQFGVQVQYMIDADTATGTCAVCVSKDGSRSLVANLAAANNYKVNCFMVSDDSHYMHHKLCSTQILSRIGSLRSV